MARPAANQQRASIGRPRKTEHERRTERYNVRITKAESADLRARAAQAGITHVEFMRRAALALDLPASHGGGDDLQMLTALDSVAHQLAPIGNNINQIAHAAHLGRDLQGKLAEDLTELETLLIGLRDLIDTMAGRL